MYTKNLYLMSGVLVQTKVFSPLFGWLASLDR